MLIFIAVAYRRITAAVVSGAIFTVALAAFSAFLYRLYGNEFIFQTFVFHFLKGHDTAGDIAAYPRMILDILVPLFVLGCWRIFADRIFSRGRDSRARHRRRRVRLLRRAQPDRMGPQLSRAAAVHRDRRRHRRDRLSSKPPGPRRNDGSSSQPARRCLLSLSSGSRRSSTRTGCMAPFTASASSRARKSRNSPTPCAPRASQATT